jgi:hypothetical protein
VRRWGVALANVWIVLPIAAGPCRSQQSPAQDCRKERLHVPVLQRFWGAARGLQRLSVSGSLFGLAAPSGRAWSAREVYTGSTRLRVFLRTTLLVSFLLSALVIAGHADRSASLPVKAIRWFLGLDEADKCGVPVERAEGSGDR